MNADTTFSTLLSLILGAAVLLIAGQLINWHSIFEWLRTERLILRSFLRFMRHHPGRSVLIARTYVRMLLRLRTWQPLRAGSALLEHISAVLKGTLILSGEYAPAPDVYARNIIYAIEADDPGPDETSRLLECIRSKTASPSESELDLKRDSVAMIQILIRNYARRRNRELCTRAALYRHYHLTYYFGIRMFLALIDAHTPPRKIPGLEEMITALAHFMPLQTLDADLHSGLINIPEEVLRSAGITPNACTDAGSCRQYSEVEEWVRQEALLVADSVARIEQDLLFIENRTVRRSMRYAWRELNAHIRRFQ
ncbi:MAG: hypothetical protein KDK34_24810 [Leptospiraceae bacterium]|nr:hypothetical protein [Leptospiraceae bacterium]MCB1323503.1 hypothetical protein [Leptospiraceae bacterium]